MRTDQRTWTRAGGWSSCPAEGPWDLVLVFGARELLEDPLRSDELRRQYGGAIVAGCSTAGEIAATRVSDDSMVATAIAFDEARVQAASVALSDVGASSRLAGKRLAEQLEPAGLRHVFVLSDGLSVNGSELAQGLSSGLPDGVPVTGGLSGDGTAFHATAVCLGGRVASGRVAALGFYGAGLSVGHGSLGGWDAFGPDRRVTRSAGNVLYELDGCSALALYRRYLGSHAVGLPASGLLFPLSVRPQKKSPSAGTVRTILAIDEAAGSITFAGDVPQGHYARLMKANHDRLVDGASGAARSAFDTLGEAPAELAILVSCVGRKLVLGQRVEEEVESVREVLGGGAVLCGFYSYGEISPRVTGEPCQLHNQTMTITTLSERRA